MSALSERTFEAHVMGNIGNRGYHGVWKLQPVVSGVPDLLVITGDGKVLFRELKVRDGRLSELQEEFHEKLARHGNDVSVWRPKDLADGTILREVNQHFVVKGRRVWL